jgi:carbon monoxide dehydrogenase subunit G
MARYNTTVQSNQSTEEAFAYLADFANAAKWDPGVASGERLTDQPVGPGSRFQLMCRFLGRQIPLEYRITTFEAPSRVVFVADQGRLSSVDEIRFVPVDAGTSVTYNAELRLKGRLGPLMDPIIALALRRIGGRAAEGLRRELNA